MPCKNCKHYYLYSNCGNICNYCSCNLVKCFSCRGTTAASSYVISNGTTAAKSSVISNEVSTDTSVSWPQAPDITCESAILVDADTGSILYEKDAHRKCYPASTTKILTGLLTIENCNLSDTLTFSTAAANSINPIEDANLGMKAGEELTVEQALYALLLYSANEVAYALAEKVAGSFGSVNYPAKIRLFRHTS